MPNYYVKHRTTYRYRSKVSLGPHLLTLLPRTTEDQTVRFHRLNTDPPAQISWTQDVFGNSVATAEFQGATEHLEIVSEASVNLTRSEFPILSISAAAIDYPFLYSKDEWIDLGALTQPQYHDPFGVLSRWVASFVADHPTDTLSLLKDLNFGIFDLFSYQSRDAEGTQSPTETIQRGWGSCRDFSVLLAEAARVLGLGARIVSGYLSEPAGAPTGQFEPGSTHAWVDIYLPGAGWVSFDPANRSFGGSNLIPVAIGRNIHQLAPVSGSFSGPSDALANLSVQVSVLKSDGPIHGASSGMTSY
ncbi:transglutaminase family protein [Histidinibacterium aquaticum]|uniref:Transglutaminase family protein n=1 Tax=Histidinibacterium aquaticum TaxID=2613962 RepID=A0A5J5GHY9_9RHOB|nr:transglutaminase family protein [Histidinibacterium aquaticum]KAA9007134.1 transglutaminase family protein [Histidinibacterium aquaticum]